MFSSDDDVDDDEEAKEHPAANPLASRSDVSPRPPHVLVRAPHRVILVC